MPRRRPVQAIAANANRATTKSRASVYNERGKSKVIVAGCEDPKANNRERSSGGEKVSGDGNAESCGTTTSKSTTPQPRWSQMDTTFQYLHKKFKKMECVESSSGGEDAATRTTTVSTTTITTSTSTPKILEDQEEHSNSNTSQLALEALFQVTGRELEKINETDCPPAPAKDPKEKEVNGNSGCFVTTPPVSKNPGRHVCPFCGHGCAKPSILQKHIRAHTNERPYTCEPCGFAFKTTSNLYKHRKSRAHALKLGLATPSSVTGVKEDEEPEEDVPEAAVEEEEEDTAEEPVDEDHLAQTTTIYKPKFHSVSTKRVFSAEEEQAKNSVPSLAKRRNEQLQLKLKIPKPPVVITPSSTSSTHSSSASSSSSPSRSPGSAAASPAKGSGGVGGDRTPKFASPEYVQQRISKLISENAAIVEIQDPLWQKRNMRHSSSLSPGGVGSGQSQSPGELKSPPSSQSPLTPSSSMQLSPRTPPMNTPSTPVIPKSKLASALLGRTFSPQPSPPPPPTPTPQTTPSTCSPPSYSSSSSSSTTKAVVPTSVIVSNGVVNPAGRNPVDSAAKSFPAVDAANVTCNSQNPGISIIKDLLLKPREGIANQFQATKKLPDPEPSSQVQVTLPVLASPQPVALTVAATSDGNRHFCVSCNMRFQKVENLQAHQSFYCRPQNAPHNAASSVSYSGSVVSKADCGPPPKARGRPKGSKNRPKNPHDGTSYPRAVAVNQPYYDPHGPELALCVLKSRVAQAGNGNNGLPDYDGPILKRHLLSRGDHSPPPAKKQLKCHAVTPPQSAEYVQCPPYIMAFAAPQNRSQLRHCVGGKVQECGASSPSMNFSFSDPAALRSVSDGEDSLVSNNRIPAPGVIKQSNPSPSSSSSSTTFEQTIAKPVLNSGGTVRQVPDAKESPGGSSSSCFSMVSMGSSRVGARTGTLSGGGVVAGESEMLIASSALTIPIAISSVPINTYPIDISHLQINVSTTSSRPTRLTLPSRSAAESPKSAVLARLGSSSQSSCSSMSPVSTPVKGSFSSEFSDNSPEDVIVQSPRSPKIVKSVPEQGTVSVRRATPATRPTTLSLRPPERPLSLTEKFLVSPETPRPKKKYAQCFHNGQHYTYLALKQSTKVFYCCIHWAQPMYVPQSAAPNLSMYSVWKTVPAEPDPLGLTPSEAMCLYDSRNRYSMYTMAQSKSPLQVTHSSYWSFKEHSQKGDGKERTAAASVSSVVAAVDDGDVDGEDSDTVINVEDDDDEDDGDSRWKDACRGAGKMTEREVSTTELMDRDFVEDVSEGDSDGTEDEDRSSKHKSGGEEDGVAEPKRVRIFEGGFKSNEDYTYVRGRGRGKYVCEECGIRCKKPSMLKKHIRTHTDVRPYTCKHCNFSFKTKGNLTKHMKSKAHHKKCVELGLDPIPVTIDDSQIDEEALVRQERIEQQRKHFANDNDDDDDEEDDEDGEEDDEYGRNFDYGDEDEEMMDVEDDSRSVHSLGQFEDAEPCDEMIRVNPSGMEGERESTVVNSRMDREAAHSLLDLSKPNDVIAMKINRLRNHKGNSVLNELTLNSSELKEIPIRRPGFLSNCPPVSTAVIVSPMIEDRDVLIGNPRVVWSVDLPESAAVQSPLYSSSSLQLLDCENEANDSASSTAYRMRGLGIRSAGEDGSEVSHQTLSKDKSVLVQAPKSSLKSALEGDGDQPMDLSMPQTRHGVPCKVISTGDAYVEEDADFAEDPWEARRVGTNAGYSTYRAETPPSVGCVDSHVDRSARYENMLSAAEDEEDDEDDAGPLKALRSSPGPLYLAPMFAGSRPHEYRRSHVNADGSGAWDQSQDEEMRRMHSFADTAAEESRENARSPCDARTRSNSTALDPLRCDTEDFRGLPSPPSAAAVAAMGVASAQKKADDTQLSSAPQPTAVVSQFGFPLRVSKVNSSSSSATSSSEVNAKQMLDYSPAVSGSGLQRSIDDGKCVCSICNKSFSKPSQLRLHVNIHYFERPFRCESCAISFRTKGHLQKHKRSVSHYNKVNMNMTFGTPTTDNPRPFKCADCKIAFRIHGHLAKHLRSKMHIMKLECLGKLPFGTYAEFERSGANLNEIDTTDCDNSLDSLRAMACKFFEDNTQQRWPRERTTSGCSSDDLSDGVPFVDPVDPPVLVQPTPPLPPPSSSTAAHQPSTVAAGGSGGSGGPATGAASTRHRTLSIGEESSVSTDLAEMWSQKSLMEGGAGGQGLVADNLPKSVPLEESLESMAGADCPGFSGRIVHQRSHEHLALVQDYEDVSDVDSDGELPTRNGHTCRMCGKVLKSAKCLQIHYSEHAARMADAEDGDADGDCASMVTAATTYPTLVQQASNVDGFDCELCARNFSSRSDLKQHLQTHALPRPFVCEVCDAGFTTAQNLKVHRYTHTRLMQDESFACNECRRVFDDFPSLESHLVRYHSPGALGQEQVRCRVRGEPSAASDFAVARPAA